VIESLAGQGMNIRACTIMLRVSESGYYDWKDRPLSARALRRVWLGGLIADVHDARMSRSAWNFGDGPGVTLRR
jgi:putative transposase